LTPLRRKTFRRSAKNFSPFSEKLFAVQRKTFRRSAKVTIQPCHCEPFFGEAISRLSGQLDRLGIASSQRTLLAMTNTTVLMQD
jgi:hypothetical protein